MGTTGHSNSSNPLFSPIKLNANTTLSHRIVLSPLTRFRSTKKELVPIVSLMPEYYQQRACASGTLLITEATYVAARAAGLENAPGIWSEDQIKAWKQVVDAVHSKGSYIYLQIWALGRAADADILKENGYDVVSASDIPIRPDGFIPRPLRKEEIREYVQLFAQAAENAVTRSCFDGVEIHCANGFLLDQFIQDVSNKRTDEYGGSVENRARFVLEVVDAVTAKIGEDKVGIRLSPWSNFNSMRMKDPIPQFSYIISQLADHHSSLSYIHIIEPRTAGSEDMEPREGDSVDFAREIWRKTGRPFLVAGGFTPELALGHMKKEGTENDVIVFGRRFLANPDLVKRIEYNLPLNPYNRDTFYDAESSEGYIDYPFIESCGL